MYTKLFSNVLVRVRLCYFFKLFSAMANNSGTSFQLGPPLQWRTSRQAGMCC